MTTPPEPQQGAPVVRTSRVEVVDTEGRVRVVLGQVAAPPEGEPSFGIAVLDASGRHRAWLALPPSGPELAIVLDGSLVAHLGVADPGEETVEVGAYLYLCDRQGRPVLGWQVGEGGSLIEEPRPDG